MMDKFSNRPLRVDKMKHQHSLKVSTMSVDYVRSIRMNNNNKNVENQTRTIMYNVS